MATATETAPGPHSSALVAPERSLNQRMDALARANQIRTKRAQLKRDLKAGRLSIHQLLLNPPEYLETAKVFDMLLAVPKYGRVKVEQDPRPLPDLAEQDDRRALRAPAQRARLAASPLSSISSRSPCHHGRWQDSRCGSCKLVARAGTFGAEHAAQEEPARRRTGNEGTAGHGRQSDWKPTTL